MAEVECVNFFCSMDVISTLTNVMNVAAMYHFVSFQLIPFPTERQYSKVRVRCINLLDTELIYLVPSTECAVPLRWLMVSKGLC